MLDQGVEGLLKTISNFNKAGIAHIGVGKDLEEAWTYEIVDQFALFSASYTCYNRTYKRKCDEIARFSNNDTFLINTIAKIRSEHPSKIITMFAHWGKEYDPYALDNQKDYARKAIDLGVELIVGSHPHIIQEFEFYKGKPIFYSLGNGIFDQDWSMYTQKGLAPVFFTDYDNEKHRHYISNIVLHEVDLGLEAVNRFQSNFKRLNVDLTFMEDFHLEGPLRFEEEEKLSRDRTQDMFDELKFETDRLLELHNRIMDCIGEEGPDRWVACGLH